jgi:cytochrome c553
MFSRRRFVEPIIQRCFLCKQPLSVQTARPYHSKYIRQWDIEVCSTCHSGNHDGIVLGQYPQLAERLNTKGINMELNERGRLDWPC